MQKCLLFLPLLFLTFCCTSVRAQTFDLTFNLASASQMNINEPVPGTYDITTTGNDAKISVNPFMPGPYDPSQVYVISFDYFAGPGLDDLEIFYGLPISAQRKASWEDLPATPNGARTFKAFMKYEVSNWGSPYQAFRFDISKRAGQSIRISNIKLRAPTATEVIPLTLNPGEINANATTVTDNGDGSLTIATSGADPYIATLPFTDAYDPEQTFVLQYDYSGDALDDFRVFFGDPWTPTRMSEFGPLAGAATTTRFTGFMQEGDVNWIDGAVDKLRLDFGRQPGKTITVSNLVLREPTNAEANSIVPPVILETVPLELDVNNSSGGMNATETAPGEYVLNTSGNDPWIRSKTVTELYNIDSTYIIEFEYKSDDSYNVLEIFFGPPINASQLLNTGELPAATDWTTRTINPRILLDNFQTTQRNDFRFDFGKNENASKQISIRNLVIRKPTAQEKIDEENSDKFISRAINLQFNQYRTRTYADKVTEVKVDSTLVTINGTVTGAGPYFLAEINPEDYGFNLETFENVLPLTVTDGAFTVQQPRYAALADRNKDRLYARWAVVTDDGDGTYTKTSPMSWATDITYAAENNLAEEKAASQKGLDGLTPNTLSNFDDLTDLGITSMKINLILNGVFAANPNASTTTHEFNGKTYNINQNFVNNLDSRIKACTDAGIKTSFVLLIPINFTNPLLDSIFTHPDASLGLYSMANVTDARGIEHYTMLVDFLAKRYSRPDGLYGRLDQWIIHNEVDAHTSWTHAGEKPAPLYSQIYDRSMRMVHFTARKYNPTAKVFGSYTKHFASKVGGENGPNFRSKEILTTINNLMKLEGDYEWGIGWHSYPTNLRNPAVWNDAISATPLNFNAAQITPRNLEVIDAFVRQESWLYNGKKVRTILLSENGFSSNTATSPAFTQERQAAALAYFWKKTDQRLSAIENIQYHRWVDNPFEGGLLFGLWTGSTIRPDSFNVKKPSWFVWEAAGTANEDAVLDSYKSVIGINDWSEIQFNFASETTPYRVLMNVVNCDDDLTDVLVSFNGEHKFPQADGTVSFFNVASNVDQPLMISKGGVPLVVDTLSVGDDLELNFDLQAVANLTATGVSVTEIALSWTDLGGGAGAGFVVERSEDGAPFATLATVTDTNYTDATVTAGTDYAYRVAALLTANTTSCFSDPATVTAPFLVVDYRNGDNNKPTNNKIAPRLQLRNESDMPVGLNDITVRYWFTAENLAPLNFWVDYAALGTNDVSGSFVALDGPYTGADHYLEMSFNTSFEVPANGNTGDIKTRITKANWTNFDETDDYSVANGNSFVETTTITLYRNGELIWGTEPTPVAPVVSLKAMHKNTDNAGNNTIKPELNLVNDGNVPVDYADLTLRYWFTPEGTSTVTPNLDYAVLGAANVTRQIVDAGDLTGGSRYLEVGFDASLGQLGAGSETGQMKFRLAKDNWSNFDETDDHSYQATGNNSLVNLNITAYLNGSLVWGIEPAAAPLAKNTAPPTELLTAPAFTAQLSPNPAVDYTDLNWDTDIKAVDHIYLLNVRGQRLPVRTEISGSRLRVRLGDIPNGLYIFGGTINGTTVAQRIVVKR
ncbi:DUF5722 domain-containing protein [Neolewinella persica]|uniref:DUF5722 domain-containing protein n=1 Tax=Neolewinella persica TaxID=70998 RepID=UPI00035F01C0|nr:DUF5722 domain-containing protein [Neolewinella persica]